MSDSPLPNPPPATGTARFRRQLHRAVQFTAAEWLLLVVAVVELLLARFKLQRFTIDSLQNNTSAGVHSPSLSAQPSQQALAGRISWAIQMAAAHVPWRSDCLVQALAAQRWLTRKQVSSELSLGVRKNSNNVVEAHAWLRCDSVVVTGGNSEEYVTLLQTGTRSQ
ncbi:MAG: lasso peptide biosynthesis B2 protein [Pseudomonadota bacterium]